MKSKIIQINKLLIKRFGIPKRKETYSDPVDVLIATILSQNTTDKNSFKAYMNLKKNFKDWDEVSASNVKLIEKNIKVGGLAKQKAKSIKNILNHLKKSQTKITLDYLKPMENTQAVQELIQFNGVGVKTASCVLLFSLKREICPVDTHVHRTLNRIGIVKTNSPGKTFDLINHDFPKGAAHSFHTNLIKLGREICKSNKPLCSICPLMRICSFDKKNDTENVRYKVNNFLLLDNV